jgi:hypothetical protein
MAGGDDAEIFDARQRRRFPALAEISVIHA